MEVLSHWSAEGRRGRVLAGVGRGRRRLAGLKRGSRWLVWLGGLLFVVASGCDPAQPPGPRLESRDSAALGGFDHLQHAFDLLGQLDDVAEDKVVPEALFHLNGWGEAQSFGGSWEPDPLVERIPRNLRQYLTKEALADPTFDMPDVSHLQEAIFLREIARWAVERPADESLESWIHSSSSGLSAGDAQSLVLASRLFDWTVRNIQQDELLPYPKDEEVGPTSKPGATGPALEMPPPLRAIPGPGYQREPLQTLFAGHGDAIERARIFGLLAQQHAIDTVVLAVFDVSVSPRPRPWAVGVLAGDRLFLFDCFLGLTLAGPEGAPIGTLDQWRKQPELLDTLQVDDQLRYPLRPADLNNLVALIDAAPITLTRRMQVLEPALVGNQQLVLTSYPSKLADRVRRIPGINNVAILPASWEAPLYRAVLMQMARNNLPQAEAALAEEMLFRQVSPVSQGRRRHLRGQFKPQERERGALGHYSQARIPDAMLAHIHDDPQVQQQMELVKPAGMSDEAWQNRLLIAESLFREAKLNASYWLGLIHLDSGNPQAAVEWFRARTLEVTPPSRWQPGARYNLARCFELTGKPGEAQSLYQADDSPQRLGNLVRAKRLAQGRPKPTS